MKKYAKPLPRTLMVIAALILLSGCLAKPLEFDLQAVQTDKIPGFLMGWWHGFTLLFSFILSIFKEDVTVYSSLNNGGWYNFGYLLGVMGFFGGSGAGSNRKKC